MDYYIVTLRPFIGERPGDAAAGELNYGPEQCQQYAADDHAHAGELADNDNPFCTIILIETHDEYESRMQL